MTCSRTRHGDACGDQTLDLSIRSPTLDHYSTALPWSILLCNIHVRNWFEVLNNNISIQTEHFAAVLCRDPKRGNL